MEKVEQRLAARVDCDVPLQMLINGGWRDVTVTDVSRTGVRLLVPLSNLDIDPDVGLAEIAERLDEILPPRAQAKFNPQRLGDLITRGVNVVRLVLVGEDGVELGCTLDESLTEIEAAALGVPVPMAAPEAVPERESSPTGWTPPTGAAHTRHRFRAIVLPTNNGRAEPLVAYTDEVDGSGVRLTVRDVALLGLPAEDEDIRARVVAFSKIYGPDVKLDVLEGTSTLFHGPATLAQVEAVPGEPNQLIVGLTFQRELEPGEQRALRLV